MEDNKRIKTMIGDDFNARIGEEEGWREEEKYFEFRDDQERGEKRASKDKVVCRREKPNKQGNGEWTFHSQWSHKWR